jgi:hypothetical protein
VNIAEIAKQSFAAGEVSEELYARDDLARQQIGVKRAENLIVLVEGGMTRAPGTRFVAPLKTESQKGLFVPFRFNNANTYDLIFNGGKMRVKTAGGIVESPPGTPYELTIPYAEAELEYLRWARDKDTMFLACEGQRPRELKRFAHANWTIAEHLPEGGPVKDMNVDEAKTIQASAVEGSITLTANDARFDPSDENTVWRLDEPDRLNQQTWKSNEVINSDSDKFDASALTKIGNLTGTTGPNSIDKAFDGVVTKNHDDGCAEKLAAPLGWVGFDCGGTPKAIARVQAFGSATRGMVFSAEAALNAQALTLELWAKTSGGSPASDTDGELMGTAAVSADANSLSVSIYSKDATTPRSYWWIRIKPSIAANVDFYVSEVIPYIWTAARVPARRRYNGNVYEALNDGDAGPNAPVHDEGDVGAGSGNVVWRFLHKGYGFVRIDDVVSDVSANATVLSRLPDNVVSQATRAGPRPHGPRPKAGPRMFTFTKTAPGGSAARNSGRRKQAAFSGITIRSSRTECSRPIARSRAPCDRRMDRWSMCNGRLRRASSCSAASTANGSCAPDRMRRAR